MKVGIIGGTGLADCDGVEWRSESSPVTSYGAASAAVKEGIASGDGRLPVAFLARHGRDGSIAPHLINFRANIAALQAVGVTHIIAVHSAGGLTGAMGPAALAVPDQLIDYTSGREQSFFDGRQSELRHVDFTYPYAAELRSILLRAAASAGVECIDGGVYGCTQGPRLETAAEVRRLINDGCDLVGMTAMPEAVLARELGLHYASLALVVNRGAGLTDTPIQMDEIRQVVAAGGDRINTLLRAAFTLLATAAG